MLRSTALLLIAGQCAIAQPTNPEDPGSIGFVQKDVWTDLAGYDVTDLLRIQSFPHTPGQSSFVTTALDFMSYGEDYGQRIRGSIVPPHAGNWRFWITGDNSAELWLSPSWKASEKRRIARASVSGPNVFDADPSQQSSAIPLSANTPYYFEILHKGGGLEDYVSVAWAYEPENYALASNGATATQSGTAYDGSASRAIDGNIDGLYWNGSTTHTDGEPNPWFMVDFGQDRSICQVKLWNRTDERSERLSNFRISVLDAAGTEIAGQDFHPPGQGSVGNSMLWSLPSSMVARRIRVSLLGVNHAGDHILSLAELEAYGEFQPETTRQIIPASVLRKQTLEPGDADGNGLPDAWETSTGLRNADGTGTRPNISEYSDTDGDVITNLKEWQLGSDPLVPNSLPGAFIVERWDDISWFREQYSIDDLVTHPGFYRPSNSLYFAAPEDCRFSNNYFGARMRAYIEPMVSGDYTFWFSARTAGELYLSTDSAKGKYAKRVIASLDPKTGAGNGIGSGESDLWDRFSTQRSKTIHLEAGQRYYTEVLLHNGHFSDSHASIAWACNGGPRTNLPGDVVHSYLKTPDDAEDDFLPDAWESQYGLDIADNGATDMLRQGERGDFDGDGLSNREEYLLGTDPTKSDSDNDGNPDWMGIPGYLYVEQWNNLPGATLNDLLGSNAFYGQPDDSYLVTQAKALTNVGDNHGLRMSGRVIAPVTGSYRFWVAGDDQCELFLSTDASATNRRSIAKVANWTDEDNWFVEPGQQSAEINLVAGQEYYLEVLMKEGNGSDHVSVAWEYPGQEIQIIPATSLKSFIAEPGDADRDGMPDAWELQVGLNPADNGATDVNQSAYSDIDGDALLNYQEYQVGGNPHVFDGRTGVLELDKWFNIPQTDLQTFFKSAQYTQAPDLRTWAGAEGPSQLQSYAARLRGTITAPETGLYTFWMSGDDQVELWLSSDQSRFGKQRIAYTHTHTSAYQWLSTPTQQSTSIRLEAGKSYFIEGLVKNFSHGGDFSIGWSRVPDSNWNTADIGISPASWTVEGRNMSVSAAGGSISGTADSFAFRYFTLQGDGEIVARMGDITAANNVARAGLMIRESLDAGSAHAMMLRTAEGRLMFQTRDSTGAEARDSFTNVTGEPFQWLKLVRKGDSLAGYESMDGKTWRLRGACSIPMNQSVFAGMAVAEVEAGGSVQTSWNDITIAKHSLIEVLPPSALVSAVPDPNDSDDDNLPDSWETSKGLNASTAAAGMGQYGDPDGDLLTNFEEYRHGSDPLQAAPVPGYLTMETWGNVFSTIHEFVRSATILAPPGTRELLAGTEYFDFESHNYFQRTQGRIVAPVTGNYRFWIAGDRDFELWLSSNSTKFQKRRIASTQQQDNDAVAVGYRDWDRFSSQMSQPVMLEAGQEYYIEILHQDTLALGHFSVAWSYTDQQSGLTTAREIIPATQLRSHVGHPDDADDDCLPDSWETATGLNPLDNGLTDLAREGEYGDYDGDLLTNREEWLAGSNPNATDSDGDGLNDYDEVKFYHSDPARSSTSAEQLVGSVPPASVAGLGQQWVDLGSGVLATNFRDDGTWNFTVPSAGFWVLRVDLKLLGDLDSLEVLPIRSSIDGKNVGRAEATFRNGGPGSIRVLSTYLTPGNHQLNLYFDNYMARRSVMVTGISVLSPAGVDANGNGHSDLIDSLLAENSTVSDRTVVESHVSPFFIEGRSRSLDLFELRVGHEGPGSTIRHKDSFWDKEIPRIQLARDSAMMAILSNPGSDRSATGAIQPVKPGPGSSTWYTGLALNPNQATGYTAFFENGTSASSGVVVWRPVNLFETHEITIPAGSELLMGAWNSQTDNSNVNFSIDGTPLAQIKAENALSHLFAIPGEYLVTAVHAKSGTTWSLTVKVEGADLQSDIVLAENHSRIVNLPGVAPHLSLDADGEISIDDLVAATSGGSSVRMGGLNPQVCNTAVRMRPGGPILDLETVSVVGVADANRNGATQGTPFDRDLLKVVSPLLVTHLPPGATITVYIFAGGVTFMDGTTEKTFTAEDLDENGIISLEMLMPRERLGAPCHNIFIHDANSVRIFSTSN
jgi:PA14 domain/F5/8 type C domain/Bacterial TSP3 repeat